MNKQQTIQAIREADITVTDWQYQIARQIANLQTARHIVRMLGRLEEDFPPNSEQYRDAFMQLAQNNL